MQKKCIVYGISAILFNWVLFLEVESAGFTMAPLQPTYRHAGESDSCLVTFVLKIDLGGFLSDDSYASALLYPFTKTIQRSFIDPALLAIIALRDQARSSKVESQEVSSVFWVLSFRQKITIPVSEISANLGPCKSSPSDE